MIRETVYFYMTVEEMKLCIGSLTLTLIEESNIDLDTRSKMKELADRMTEEIAK